MWNLWVSAAIGLSLLAPGMSAASQAADHLPSHPNAACSATGGPVNEGGFVSIGGILQWVTVNGDDCDNPVVLMVHGGPGNPSTPYADAVYGSWSGEFTVVQWDQRGAGKTYAANPPAEDERLTIERLTNDGVEVARWALRRLGKRKVILMGGSWGSALAVHMAQAEPELFSAYMGTAQLVSRDGTLASYRRTLELARAAGDGDTVDRLEALGAPPWSNPRNSGILRRATRKYEALATDPAPAGWFTAPGAGYDTLDYEAAYEAGEEYSYIQFVGMEGDGIVSRLNLHDTGLTFEMPVYLLQGDNDLVTPPEISRAYFDTLTAPHKEFIRLQRTGHDPNQRMVNAQLAVLRGLRAE